MAVLKFRVSLEEDEAVYRDIAIIHKQRFDQLHYAILKSWEFDNKHAATFFRSNDNWQQGREITFEVYDKPYVAPPLLMSETTIGSEVKETNQKFIYQYDFEKKWTFLIELIGIEKDENIRLDYPCVTRVEGIGPPQYGTKTILGDRFSDIEEKYDLQKGAEGFGEEDENGESIANESNELGDDDF
jgi:hypothetical protein